MVYRNALARLLAFSLAFASTTSAIFADPGDRLVEPNLPANACTYNPSPPTATGPAILTLRCTADGKLITNATAGGGGGSGSVGTDATPNVSTIKDGASTNKLAVDSAGKLGINSLPAITGTVGVSSLPSLSAGSAAIGTVGVTALPSIPSGSNAIGTVGVTALPSLPAGGNAIGTVGVSSLPSLAAGSAAIGTVGVTSLPALSAGTANIGTVTVTRGVTDSTVTTFSATTTGAVALAANANRKGLIIYSTSTTATLFVRFGTTNPTTTAFTAKIPPSSNGASNYVFIDGVPPTDVRVVTDTGTDALSITELI